MPGYDVRVINVEGEQAAPEEIGDMVVKLPLPPGALPTLWHNDEGFRSAYLERVRRLLPHRRRGLQG